jgi:hypothetical protein
VGDEVLREGTSFIWRPIWRDTPHRMGGYGSEVIRTGQFAEFSPRRCCGVMSVTSHTTSQRSFFGKSSRRVGSELLSSVGSGSPLLLPLTSRHSLPRRNVRPFRCPQTCSETFSLHKVFPVTALFPPPPCWI